MGWFFNIKLHLICNKKGKLLNFMITSSNVNDRNLLEYKLLLDSSMIRHEFTLF